MLSAFLASASAADLEATVDKALAVHVPPKGLARLGDAVEALVPASITLEGGTGTFDCGDSTAVDYTLDTLDLNLSADEVAVVPSEDRLDISLFLTLSSPEGTAAVTGDCALLVGLDETCTLQVPVTAIQIDFAVTMEWVDDAVLAAATTPTVTVSPIGNPLSDCALASAVGTLLGQDPDTIADLILAAIEPGLDELPTALEDSLESTLDALVVDTEVALLDGASLELLLEPTRLDISEDGLVIGLGATMGADVVRSCVDLDTQPEVPDLDWPAFAATPEGSSLEYDAGLVVNKAFADQLLWIVWGTGVLCLDIEDLQGAPLTTGLLAGFFGEEMGDLLGDVPAKVSVNPTAPPTTRFSDDQPPLVVDLSGLGLAVTSTYEHRALRVLEVTAATELGVGIALADGELATELLVDPDAMRFEETYSKLLFPGYSANVPALVDLALGIVLPDDLLPTIGLPDLLGIELSDIIWHPSPDGQWLGGYLLMDTADIEPVELGGCTVSDLGCDGSGGGVEIDVDELLGCDDTSSGCEGQGCSVTVPTGRLVPLLVIMGAAFRRRR